MCVCIYECMCRYVYIYTCVCVYGERKKREAETDGVILSILWSRSLGGRQT